MVKVQELYSQIKDLINFMTKDIFPFETKEDCKQEAWLYCLKQMSKYNPEISKPSTYFRRPIKTGICKVLKKESQYIKTKQKLYDKPSINENQMNVNNDLEELYIQTVVKDKFLSHKSIKDLFYKLDLLKPFETDNLRVNIIDNMKDKYYGRN